MRYHWGLGVGHIHAHQHMVPLAAIPQTDSPDVQLEHEPDATLDVNEIYIQIDLQDGTADQLKYVSISYCHFFPDVE